MKNLKKIEDAKMNFNENHKLTPEEMSELQGGTGCICLANGFWIGRRCACNVNPFGLCRGVTGPPGQPGVPGMPGVPDGE